MTHQLKRASIHGVWLCACLLGSLGIATSCGSQATQPNAATGGVSGGASGGSGSASPGSGGARTGGTTAAGSGGAGAVAASTGAAGGTAPTGSGGQPASPGSTGGNAGKSTGGAGGAGATSASGGVTGTGGSAGTAGMMSGSAGGGFVGTGMRPFPQTVKSPNCTYPTNAKSSDVVAAYDLWKTTVVTADGAGGFLRVKKPDSGSVIGSTVSEGIGYGMLLAVYMGDQALFDSLWKYSQLHLDGQGFMNWEIGPHGSVTAGGNGGATDGDEDIAWSLVMADKQWGGRGTLSDTYLNLGKHMIDIILMYEVDHAGGEVLKPGNNFGGAGETNPSYFAPAYYRVFGQVSGKTADWNKVIDSCYSIISKSLNAANGNTTNGLVPAWCNSAGVPVAFGGAILGFQNDATRTPFRVGQDYCLFGEPRAKDYLAKISAFYAKVGIGNITNGYTLTGTPQPDKVYAPGLQAASFVGPAAVGAMIDAQYQQLINDGYASLATQKLTAGTIYYQKSWTALSLLMLNGALVDFTAK